jgi:hypothetical protein
MEYGMQYFPTPFKWQRFAWYGPYQRFSQLTIFHLNVMPLEANRAQYFLFSIIINTSIADIWMCEIVSTLMSINLKS